MKNIVYHGWSIVSLYVTVWFLYFSPLHAFIGSGTTPGVSLDLVADFQYLRTAYAIDTNLKFSDNLFAALSRSS